MSQKVEPTFNSDIEPILNLPVLPILPNAKVIWDIGFLCSNWGCIIATWWSVESYWNRIFHGEYYMLEKLRWEHIKSLIPNVHRWAAPNSCVLSSLCWLIQNNKCCTTGLSFIWQCVLSTPGKSMTMEQELLGWSF